MDKLGYEVGKLLHHLEPLALDGHEIEGFAVSNYMFFLLIALFLTFLFFALAARRVSLVPSGMGNVGEAAVEFVRNNIVADVMGRDGLKYLPFIVTVFFFVLFNNLLGLVPSGLPGTGTMGTTATWGVMVFIVYNWIGFQKNGFAGYMKSFLPSGTPWWLAWLIYPLELISHFLRPFTLAVRLYANMYAGHIVLGVFVIFIKIVLNDISASGVVVGLLSFLMLVIMYAFEVFVAFIQAYVFTILTSVYISGALHAKDH